VPSDTRRSSHRSRPSLTALHDSTRTSETRIQAAGAQVVAGGGEDESESYPHDSLVRNIHRFMRYSSAAYGVSLNEPPMSFLLADMISAKLPADIGFRE
jgi:hypothetical protein